MPPKPAAKPAAKSAPAAKAPAAKAPAAKPAAKPTAKGPSAQAPAPEAHAHPPEQSDDEGPRAAPVKIQDQAPNIEIDDFIPENVPMLKERLEKMNQMMRETSVYIENCKSKINLQEFQVAAAKRSLEASKNASGGSAPAESPLLAVRVPKLEQQLSELLDEVEALTEEKQRLMLDYDNLEDNYLKAQVELEATKKALQGDGKHDGEDSSLQLSEKEQLKILKVENEKLREGLRRLNELSKKDKDMLREVGPKFDEREKECMELREWKKSGQSKIAFLEESLALQSTFEAQIEKLNEQNITLSESIKTYRQTIEDLEDEKRINDELDAESKLEMDYDKQTIQSMETTITALEKKLSERDLALGEQNKSLERMRLTLNTMQKEADQFLIADSLKTDNQKELENHVVEASKIKTQDASLKTEIASLFDSYAISNGLKFQYQSMFERMDSLFGDNKTYNHEAKLLKAEVAYVSSVSVGFEVVRQIVSHFDQWMVEKTDRRESEKAVATVGKLYLLLLQVQAFCVQANMFIFKEPLTAPQSFEDLISRITATPAFVAQNGANYMLKLKEVLDGILSLSMRLGSISKSRILPNFAQFAKDDSAECAVAEKKRNEAMGFIMQGFESQIDQLQALMPGNEGNVDGGSKILESSTMLTYTFNNMIVGPRETKYPSYPMVQIEMLYVAINGLCNLGIYQADKAAGLPPKRKKFVAAVAPPVVTREEGEAEGEEAAEAAEAPPLPAVAEPEMLDEHQNTPEAIAQLDSLKAIKADVKTSLMHLNKYSSNYMRHADALNTAYQKLLSCFSNMNTNLKLKEGEESTNAIKAVLASVKKINGDVVPSNAVSEFSSITSVGVTRYFPAVVMANMVEKVVSEQIASRKQYSTCIEEFWNLLIVGQSTLINADLSTTVAECSWKLRTGEFKKKLREETTAAEEALDAMKKKGKNHASKTEGMTIDPNGALTPAPNTPVRASMAPDTAGSALTLPADVQTLGATIMTGIPRDMVSREAYRRLRKELEVKKDELKMVLRRMVEESDAAALKKEKAANSIVSKIKKNFFAKRAAALQADRSGEVVKPKITEIEVEDLRSMQKEITMLEAALESTEDKLEVMSKENRVMKQILQQPQGFTALSNITASYAPPPATPDKVDRRFAVLTNNLPEANASAASILHHLSQTSHKHLLDQVSFWKRMALTKLTNSLIELPNPGTLKTEKSGRGSKSSPHQSTDSLSSMALGGLASPSKDDQAAAKDPMSQKSRRARRSKIEVLLNGTEYKPDATSASHNKVLYRSLRKLRAETIRIASLDDSNNKGVGGNKVQTRQAFITFRIAH